jgi:hypothetical protein
MITIQSSGAQRLFYHLVCTWKNLSADILGSKSLYAETESDLEMGQMKVIYSKQLHADSYTGCAQ